ncbi:zinc finger protein 454-like isoform X4 [Vanessa atalanta]|uniref:zinc finger protein 454-like isoform X4 n=1 Tax=Vanessa atalanta TaxID=42275 RepID=UPI001FCCD247|nr:zinc finger protein 454-like isoform X4 [Vanessa atalanta]
MASKTTEWRPGPTVCRCCLTEGCYKDISTEYFWMGKREVYAEMLSETFDLSIAYSQSGGPNSHSRLICEPCISRLRDAADFKRQVQECERTFMQYLDPGSSLAELEVGVDLDKEVKVERVKEEKEQSDDDEFDDRPDFGDDDDYDDLDDQPLTKLASKVPKKESVDVLDLIDNAKVTVKRKSSSKTKVTPAKKAKTKKDIATSSKEKPEPRKKKGEIVGDIGVLTLNAEARIENAKKMKDADAIKAKKKNASILLENTRICPFRWMKNLYLCFYCDQQFTDPTILRHHNSSDHNSQTLMQIKTALSRLKKHELVKADVSDLSCKLCIAQINNFEDVKIHLIDKHGANLDINSQDGVLPFKITKNNFPCAICEEKFDEFKTLNHHMNIHYQNFICEQCGSGFITPDRLRTHAFSHETGAFACEICDKVFRSMNAKNEHFATVHKKVKRHRCPYCPETFRNYFQRNKHISTIHGMKLKEFKCSLCPKVFTSSGKIGVHVRTVHLKMKRHACHVCEWKFYSKSELKEHMIRHGGERKFQCNICKKAYARKYTLREHMRIHEDDRRFICTICGGSFVQKCSLKHHVKVNHPSVKTDEFQNLVS